MPLDLVGPGSGLDYFLAVDILQKEFYAGTATIDVAKIPYWENLFPDATGLKPSGSVRLATPPCRTSTITSQPTRSMPHMGFAA